MPHNINKWQNYLDNKYRIGCMKKNGYLKVVNLLSFFA